MSARASSRASTVSASRAPRSRLDRPCDACRQHKHLCMLPVRGEPCVACKTRGKLCTFDTAPSARKRRRRDTADAAEQMTESSCREASSDATRAASAAAFTVSPVTSSDQWANIQLGSSDMPASHRETPGHIGGSVNQMLDSVLEVGRPRLAFNSQDPTRPSDASVQFSRDSADPSMPDLPSLDLEEDEGQESHFLGSGAFAGFALRESSLLSGPSPASALSFRQVSSDPKTPVIFIKSPSLMYGRTRFAGKAAFDGICDTCRAIDGDIPSMSLAKFQRVTLPAVPFINSRRLETACLGQRGSGPTPYALLAGIIAHTTPYIPQIRQFHKALWQDALLALDDEYRLPRLSTLQLALLLMYSRPVLEQGENAGQVDIGLARACGAAHLLGLHLDPSNWALPLWERTLRKRIWWALLVQDKWRALLYGRPSNLHERNYRVSLPTVEDGDWGRCVSALDRISLESFIATCRLTQLVNRILDNLQPSMAIFDTASPIALLTELEDVIRELVSFERSLPSPLPWQGRSSRLLATLPTGVRSFQLSYLGLAVIVHRLLLDSITETSAWQAPLARKAALDSCRPVVDFTASISQSDKDVYWAAFSSHHLSNTFGLILRIILGPPSSQNPLFSDALKMAKSLVSSLVALYHADRWDVAGAALRRVLILLNMTDKDVPELRESTKAIAAALNIGYDRQSRNATSTVADMTLAAPTGADADPLGLLGPTTSDPLAWLSGDISWVSGIESLWTSGEGDEILRP